MGKRNGGQTQRFQPVSAFDVDQKVFQDWCDLPIVHDAIGRIVTAWWDTMPEITAQRRAEGFGMENPNRISVAA